MPKPRTKKKHVLYSVVTVIIIVVALELGLHAIDFVASRVKKNPGRLPFHGLYQGREWAQSLARESEKPHRDQIYHQYLSWISKPVQGRLVNIDRKTGRKTWNPQDLPPDATSIFFFGGSAAWGYGARDNYTIPSQLSRLLNAQEPHFRVYNYGEPAYTFTQGVFYLITRLQEGSRPNHVIFYDGFNDVYGAYQSGQAGTLHNVTRNREKLESKPRQIYWQAVKEWFKENIYLYNKVVNKIYLHFHPAERYREVGARLNDRELQALAAELVRYYAQSLMLLDHLSRSYGFKYVCFWQPAIYTESKVMPKETKIDVRLGDKKFGKLYRFSNQRLDRQVLPNFHNIADTVSTRTQPCYVDLVHMTEEGYGMVAARIYEILKKEFPSVMAGSSG
jgi:lysophospholipase L1-like esterase